MHRSPTIAALAVMLLAAPAAAQDKSKRSAEDYVRILSGEAPAPRARQMPAPTADTQPNAPPQARFAFVMADPRVDLQLTFPSGSATLTSAARAEARTVATALRHPNLRAKRFRIEGHTDSVGSRASNLGLSQRRADAVKAYLVAQGVTRARLDAKGYGFDRPLPGRAASFGGNRRVEAVALP